MNQSYGDIIVTSELEFGEFNPNENSYVHKYEITITNNSTISFQLLRRMWEIGDGLSWKRVVKGDGVVGEQPIIMPGESFSYNSWCPIPSTAGYMSGEFYCINIDNDEEFTVDVPQMNFIAHELQN